MRKHVIFSLNKDVIQRLIARDLTFNVYSVLCTPLTYSLGLDRRYIVTYSIRKADY